MFGLLKENILNKLENVYSEQGEAQFKSEFAKFMKTIKESKDLKQFYNIYAAVNEAEFNEFSLAKDFVDECVSYLNSLNKSEVNKLKTILESEAKDNPGTINNYLDQLVFNSNLTIKEKYEYKTKLISSILKEGVEDRKNCIKVINNNDQKIAESIKGLNESQIAIIDLFVENDQDKIKDFFSALIAETQEKIDNKIIESKDKSDMVINLIEAKRKLKTMIADPTLENIEAVLTLKSDF